MPDDTALSSNTAPAFANTSETRSLDESVGDAVTAEDAVVDLGAPLAATDADDDDTLTYSLEGADSASFAIDAATGQLRSRAGVRYDHEAQSSYALTVTADDGNDGTASVDVTVEVTDVDDAAARPGGAFGRAGAGEHDRADGGVDGAVEHRSPGAFELRRTVPARHERGTGPTVRRAMRG